MSQDALEVIMSVSQSFSAVNLRTDLPDVTLWVKRPTEDFTDLTLATGNTYYLWRYVRGGDGVMDMEVDKVANEEAD